MRAMLLAERVWALAWPASGVLLFYIALSLFGVWDVASPGLHRLAVALLAGCAVFSLTRNFGGFGFPRTTAAMRRLEDENGLRHRPLDTLNETLAAGRGDPVAEALWRAHMGAASDRSRRLRLTWPKLALGTRDPRALRYLGLLLVIIGFWAAGSDAVTRLAKSLDLGPADAPAMAPRIDAWIDPPAYTKLPPVFLGADTKSGSLARPVPAGSKLTVRIQGGVAPPRLRLIEHSPYEARRAALTRTGADSFSGSVVLRRNSSIELRRALDSLARFDIAVAADAPPRIAFGGPVQITAQKALRVPYHVQDDYGVAKVVLRMSRGEGGGKPADIALPAPARSGDAVLHANVDLTAHPWAGLPVQLTLVARDGAGQEGQSTSVTVTLPERVFTNPLARALAAARRDMMRDENRTGAAANVIDEVSEALAKPEESLDRNRALILSLRSAFWALADASERNEDARLYAGSLMWSVAVALDDGAAGEAKNALDSARQALAEALKSGASQAEIAQRLDALRAALSKYLAALEAKLANAPVTGPVNPALRAVTPQDFERLLNTLENLARTGAKGEAQNMLSALDDILQNLATNPDGQGGEETTALDEALKTLSDMLGQQRGVMDDTFRATQTEIDGAKMNPKSLRGLEQRQETLRRALGGAMTQLGERLGSIPKGLGRAERAMNAAREALGNGQGRGALDKEQEALEALREGARDMAKSLARAGTPGGRTPGGMPASDPFGRPNAGLPDQGDSVKVPDGSEAQRARDILEEIRRRAAERGRPPEELDYLDRLLEQF